MVTLMANSGREKTIHFGDANLKDYTLFSASEREDRKRAYLARHKATENWQDPESAGFWSRWVLWGPHPSVRENLRFVLNKFNLN